MTTGDLRGRLATVLLHEHLHHRGTLGRLRADDTRVDRVDLLGEVVVDLRVERGLLRIVVRVDGLLDLVQARRRLAVERADVGQTLGEHLGCLLSVLVGLATHEALGLDAELGTIGLDLGADSLEPLSRLGDGDVLLAGLDPEVSEPVGLDRAPLVGCDGGERLTHDGVTQVDLASDPSSLALVAVVLVERVDSLGLLGEGLGRSDPSQEGITIAHLVCSPSLSKAVARRPTAEVG